MLMPAVTKHNSGSETSRFDSSSVCHHPMQRSRLQTGRLRSRLAALAVWGLLYCPAEYDLLESVYWGDGISSRRYLACLSPGRYLPPPSRGGSC
jgi:hypothetical protein